jgi:hypothetical protein
MGIPPDMLMESLTSTDFLALNQFYDKDDWEEPSRTDYQLALLCQMVFRFMAMFGKGKVTIPPVEDFLVKFTPREAVEKKDIPRRRLRIGDPLDEYWQKVNDDAKRRWAGIIAAIGGTVMPATTIPSGLSNDDSTAT